MADISESVCLNHPDTPAVTRCASCNKPICEKCIVTGNGGLSYCSKKCAENAIHSVKRVDQVLENKKKVDAKSRTRGIVIIVILLAILAAAVCFYHKNKEDVDRVMKKTERKINRTMKDTKKSIEKSLPSSSTYKRDREKMVE